MEDVPGGPVVGNLPAIAGDMGSVLALGRSNMPRGHKYSAEHPRA